MRGISRGAQRGYTMIEMFMVLGIISIVFFMFHYLFTSHSRSSKEVDTATQEVVMTLKYAREVAVTTQGSTVTLYSGSPARYTLTNGTGTVVMDKTVLPLTVTLSASTAMSTITFSSNGSTSVGGTFSLVGDAGRTDVVTVTQALGTASWTNTVP